MQKINLNVKDKIEVTIEKLIFGGAGLARYNGAVIFVPYSAPQDHLLVEIRTKKKNFYQAEIIEILTPSPNRTQPECIYYQTCGGCNWQHIQYDEQLSQKNQIVLEQLKPFISEKTKIYPINPSPKQFRYRNRIQLKYESGQLGYYKKNSHQIVDIKDCLIADETVCAKIISTKQELSNNKSADLKVIELRHDGIRNSGELNFSQVNSDQNATLTKTAIQWLTQEFNTDDLKNLNSENSNSNTVHFWDLYCGNGNFSFPLYDQLNLNVNIQNKFQITGVELSESSIEEAMDRASLKKINNIHFFKSDVDVFIKRHLVPNNSIILLDPPRAGASEYLIQTLKSSPADKIVYISCDPASLRRDLSRLIQSDLIKQSENDSSPINELKTSIVKNTQPSFKWELSKIQAFDMFPQTDHIETMVEIVKVISKND